ncbi:MAG TPA: NADAR family protein [Chryseolinea sp.]|nr:NADAR family protein [Chryseolinea sp.]
MKYDLAWLKQTYDSGNRPEFLFFADAPTEPSDSFGHAMLTQWYPSGFSVQNDRYLHAAHWMMVKKARLFDDGEAASDLLALKEDQEIMTRGRQIVGFDQKRWDAHKFSIVVEGNLHKFSQHQSLHKYISGTHPLVLTEANPNDRVWGIGLPESAPGAMNPHHWKGLNLLGFALMEVRDILGGLSEVVLSFV